MSSRVVGQGDGVAICEAVPLTVETAEKSQIAVEARKENVNAGTSSEILLCALLVRFHCRRSVGRWKMWK
jgi:hypothetical protein